MNLNVPDVFYNVCCWYFSYINTEKSFFCSLDDVAHLYLNSKLQTNEKKKIKMNAKMREKYDFFF